MEGAKTEGEGLREGGCGGGEGVEAFAPPPPALPPPPPSFLSGSSVQTCCSVESEPSSSDSYP